MSTYRELVYMVLDKLKGNSDDFYYTEDHVIFLLNKYRPFILKQRYSDVKKQIPESNYQTICLELIEVPAIAGELCGNTYLRSKIKIPYLMQLGNPVVYPINYYIGNITYISRERMRYVGYNKYLPNIIYCSIGPDNYLYFTSKNPQFLHLEQVSITGIFQDSLDTNNCAGGECDVLDTNFPIEESLIAPLLEVVVKDLSPSIYAPEDSANNAADDLSGLSTKAK